MRRSLSLAAPAIAALLIAAGSATALSAQAARNVARPSGWRVVMDRQSSDTVAHEAMPPGWHMTTGPGALLFDPAYHAVGRYSVEAELFLFPGTSQSGYGLFTGGHSLDGSAASYLAFLVRRDGQAALEYVAGDNRTALIPWKTSPAVKAHPGGEETVLNALTLTVDRDSILVEANGQRVGAVARGAWDLDGTFGFRAGPDVNLHASRLDLRTRFAPVPEPRKK